MNTIDQQALRLDEQVGRRLRQARREKGLTQTQLADFLGVTFQQVQKYENGTNRLSSSALVLVARAMGLRPGYFLDDLAARVDDPAPAWLAPAERLLDDAHGERLLESWDKLSGGDRRMLAGLAETFASRPLTLDAARKAA